MEKNFSSSAAGEKKKVVSNEKNAEESVEGRAA